jgi:glycosyltransferase involved in cell wall biosynthesis
MQAVRMKIAFVTETYPPEVNGVALTVQSLVRSAIKLGHQVSLYRPRQDVRTDADEQRMRLCVELPGAKLPMYRGLQFGLPAKSALMRHWHSLRPDAIYVATEGPLGFSAVSAARALRIPVVTGFHTRFDHFLQHYRLGVLSRAAFGWMRYFHNRADATLVPTIELQRYLQGRGFRSVERLSRAVNTSLFHAGHRSDALRASWGAEASSLVCLHVGRMAAEKNLQLAVRTFDALAQAEKRPSTARMIWVGDGPELAQMRARLASDDRHIFAGMLRGESLSQAYASADLFVFPSQTETFGNVTLEALASGVPVLAFDYGAAHEAIKPEHNGATAPLHRADLFIDAALALRVSIRAGAINPLLVQASVSGLSQLDVARGLVHIMQVLIQQRQPSFDSATRGLHV